jgi:arabinose-5-phosphate isomerase
VLGIITDGDLRRMLQSDLDLGDLEAADIMSKNPLSIAPETHAMKAFTAMRDRSITQLIVVDNDEYLGIIHLHDLIREGFI